MPHQAKQQSLGLHPNNHRHPHAPEYGPPKGRTKDQGKHEHSNKTKLALDQGCKGRCPFNQIAVLGSAPTTNNHHRKPFLGTVLLQAKSAVLGSAPHTKQNKLKPFLGTVPIQARKQS